MTDHPFAMWQLRKTEHSPFSIRYDYLAAAQAEYRRLGYKPIEVPWCVSERADAVTRPAHVEGIKTKFGNLVGSAEQSFIQMMLDGQLTEGLYQTITPCFRDESEIDPFHQRMFMKLELIRVVRNNDMAAGHLDAMILNARTTLGENTRGSGKIGAMPNIVQTDSGFDLCMPKTGIEIGSYGWREYDGHRWVYGTGLAEPRYSTALYFEGLMS